MTILKKSKNKARVKPLYKRVYVIINPASGKDEPILNMLNDVFNKYGVEWDIFVTKKFGDAEKAAKYAVKHDYDLVVGYGGDGTQHELVNGIIGKKITMGILPGGTGNGFGGGLGIPRDTKKALEILMTSKATLEVDLVLKKGGKVLVHCKHGVHRSVAMVVAILMYQGLSKKTGYNISKTKKKRSRSRFVLDKLQIGPARKTNSS